LAGVNVETKQIHSTEAPVQAVDGAPKPAAGIENRFAICHSGGITDQTAEPLRCRGEIGQGAIGPA